MNIDFLIIGLLIIILVIQAWILFIAFHIRRVKENEYYTDYVHKHITMRVFKPEFEFQAIGNIERGKLLDRGNLSPYYMWALIEI